MRSFNRKPNGLRGYDEIVHQVAECPARTPMALLLNDLRQTPATKWRCPAKHSIRRDIAQSDQQAWLSVSLRHIMGSGNSGELRNRISCACSSPRHLTAEAFMSVTNDVQESYQKDGTHNVSTFNFYLEYVRLFDDRRILVQGI